MSKYKRLTNKDWKEHYDIFEDVCCDTCSEDCGQCERNFNALVRLAELEDKIENGRLVELPCKVGDTVYGVGFTCCMKLYASTKQEKRKICNECVKMDAECHKCKYGIPAIEKFVCTQIQLCDDKYTYIVGKRYKNYRPDDVFLTQEEAEARLKELQEEKK